MIKSLKRLIESKKGMTLVELMTAMTILMLMLFCFAPLMLSYLTSVNISGEKMSQVQTESGVLQVLLGGGVAKDGYTVPVNNVPVKLTSPAATVSGVNYAEATIDSNVHAYGLSSRGTHANENGIINLDGGYTTITTDELGSSSGIRIFPSSLTDDFQKAFITIYGHGIEFTLSDCTLSATGLTSEIKLTKGVDYDLEYHPDRALGTTNMLLLTIYGGGDKISFETSPLLFKHSGQIYEIQVDAPMMIMVGEKSLVKDDDGNEYHYYVSRGELDEDGDLLIHRRVMNTTDDENDSSVSASNPITLNSAMNDVEWVPVESASADNGSASNDSEYGYYVMCGDNGQVRRFWKRPSTTVTVDGYDVEVDGNYYWGGDYTYYTDYNLNRFSGGNTYINTTDESGNASTDKVYSTDVSFKYIAMRPMFWGDGKTPNGDTASDGGHRMRTGFNMSSKKYTLVGIINTASAHLRNLCTVSANYGDEVQFYGSDGQVLTFVPNTGKNNKNVTTLPTYTENLGFYNSGGSFGGYNVSTSKNESFYANNGRNGDLEAWGWLDPKDDASYYNLVEVPTGMNKDSYPITLTSVDAIQLTGTGAYETNVTDTSKSHYFTSGVIKDTDTSGDATSGSNASAAIKTETNLTYPTENYTLYCGYIPAYMDAWASASGSGTYVHNIAFAGDNAQYGRVWNANSLLDITGITTVGRASNRNTLGDNAEYNTLWRATMGITPYIEGTNQSLNIQQSGVLGHWGNLIEKNWLGRVKDSWYFNTVYYPYTNLKYAITGKYYDTTGYNNNKDLLNSMYPGKTILSPMLVTSHAGNFQTYTTAGRIIDITISYLSDPMAIAISANPTDDVVYDLANNKDDRQAFYWHNRREAITFLDSATTVVPSGENDISVSLMVGYVLGGLVAYGNSGKEIATDPTSIMNNGIVFLRAGTYNAAKHDSSNAETGEYKATDNTGYKLDQESNTFHQFYYLNSRTDSGFHGENWAEPSKGNHIGNLYGAEYWQNNRHIISRSILGGAPTDGISQGENKYEYLRAHPMTDTKVNCVAWGTTWDGYPEAMWGTENGTVLSWYVNTSTVANGSANDWNDRSVDAEIQSYTWIDSVDGKTYAAVTSNWGGTIGSAMFDSGSTTGAAFTQGSDRFKYFYDKGTQATSSYGTIGFINTLETINDITFADDLWVAAGDQSDVDPADYSATGSAGFGNSTEGTYRVIKPYIDKQGTGRGGSWINVRYWVDVAGTGKHTEDNAIYHWTAVQISTNKNYNVVQINQVNGIWIATGYIDGSNGGKLNDEYDEGEKTVICWTYDPLKPCGTEGGWSENVKMYDGTKEKSLNEMGGINSVATRD